MNLEDKPIKQDKILTAEAIVWGFAILVIIYRISVNHAAYGVKLGDDFWASQFQNVFLIGVLMLIPLLSWMIFEMLPITFLVFLFLRRPVLKQADFVKELHEVTKDESEDPGEKEQQNTFLLKSIAESDKVARYLFSRSGVFLFIGGLVAVGGVVIFYSPLFETKPGSPELGQRLLDYLPRFGALFFIEFIAIFFLRQYRVILEEYRYYEAIKRERQDNYNYLMLLEKYQDNEKILDIIKNKNFNSSQRIKLAPGETTETIEIQKMMNQDKTMMDKMMDLVQKIKG